MLKAERVYQCYDGLTVISDVSVSIDRGQVVVLLGKSGSGKSTLLRTIAMVDHPSSGYVYFFEECIFPVSINGHQRSKLWPQVTLVSQEFDLWPHLSIYKNISLPAALRSKNIDDLPELCDRLGINSLLNRYPDQVSVGQRQRVALARALLLRPKFLLIDEITSAQDVQHIQLILDVLCDYINYNMGIFVVTHHLGFARKLLNKSISSSVLFMNNGTIVEAGGLERLDEPLSTEFRTYLALCHDLA